jgi:homoserine O-acetyltransferase/O-succinyltransferase
VTRRRSVRAAPLVFICALLAVPAAAAPLPAPDSGNFVLNTFRFGSGEVLRELTLHYRTFGAPRRDSRGSVSNAVLVLHGTTGSGAQFVTENFAGVLFGPGQLLDAARWYLILPDSIGHGNSSKPSDGLRARFPHYDYDDMVDAQYRLLTEGLGVNHLRLVIGTSMGGMQAWVWGERYAGFMDGLVPLASVPAQIAGRNRVLRKMILDDIRTDPGYRDGDYETQPRGLAAAVQILLIMTSSPLQWLRAAPTRDAADRFLEEQMRLRLASADANDFVYAFDASRNYDPSSGLERIRVPVLAINSADDLVNPPELGLMDRLITRVRRGRFVLLPITNETRGHGTHSYPAIWQKHLEGFLQELPEPPPPAPVGH